MSWPEAFVQVAWIACLLLIIVACLLVIAA